MERRNFKKNNSNGRITLLEVLFFVLAFIFIGRLFYLQIIQKEYYTSLAETRHESIEELKPNRGEIFAYKTDLNGNQELTPLAVTQEYYLLYGIPSLISNATSTIALIEKVLPMNDEERWQTFLKLEKNNDPYEPLRHYITKDEKEQLEQLQITGIGFQSENKRIYPQNNLFSHLLGFLGYRGEERVGQYGLEEYFESELAGTSQLVRLEKDPKGRLISLGSQDSPLIDQGIDLVLTIDPTVQFKTCSVLVDWQQKMLAESGTAIVLEPSTGRLLALCNSPDFNLNNYSQVDNIDIYLNKAVNTAYEPGSVFKPITMSAAIDLDRITPDTQYEDKGFVKLGDDIIHNANNTTYGLVNMTQVLDESINTGTVYISLEMGRKNFKKYVNNFGFGQLTGIELPSESPGDISSLDKQADIYTATASYGQGILTTPLQLTLAFGAIANGGLLMQPQIILEKIYPNGNKESFEPEQVRRVISSKTANIIKAMLVSVVKNGHASRAAVPNYYVAGKTGTANIADPRGGYTEATNHTFVGFAPVDQPRFVVLIKFEKAKNVAFAADSTAPAFAEIAHFLLNYYQIPPNF